VVFELGFERAGMKCLWQCEIDELCRKVLAKHWPDVRRYEDVRTIGKHNLEPVDVICGGFPCQDVSLAGKQLGINGERSILWKEYFRIICEINPKWVVAENVRGLLSANNGEFFGMVLRDLASIGFNAEWRMFRASWFGAPHERQRIVVIAYPNKIRQRNVLSNITGFQAQEKPQLWDTFRTDGREVFVETAHRILGDYDGSSISLDRLGQCGNAIIPQMSQWIAERIANL
jgi:DNA (cytosine-5)-methyltransferase 1